MPKLSCLILNLKCRIYHHPYCQELRTIVEERIQTLLEDELEESLNHLGGWAHDDDGDGGGDGCDGDGGDYTFSEIPTFLPS